MHKPGCCASLFLCLFPLAESCVSVGSEINGIFLNLNDFIAQRGDHYLCARSDPSRIACIDERLVLLKSLFRLFRLFRLKRTFRYIASC